MDENKRVVMIDGESIELHEGEQITDETLAELTGGKGEDE